MLSVNFFDRRINIEIYFHRGGHVEVNYKGNSLVSEPRERCFNRIKDIVDELDKIGGKEIYFSLIDYSNNDSSYYYARSYLKSHLSVLKSTAKSYIEIKD